MIVNTGRRDVKVLRILSVIALVVPLAGCLGGQGGSDLEDPPTGSLVEEPRVGHVIEHEEGTAREFTTDWATQAIRRCHFLGPTLSDTCEETYPLLDEAPSAGGVPNAHLDVLEVSFSETSHQLILTMEIAELDEEWSGIRPGMTVNYAFEWTRENPYTALDSVWLAVTKSTEGVSMTPNYWIVSEECSDWWVCLSRVQDHQVEYGAPGRIQLTIDRAVMSDSEEGSRLNQTGFHTWATYGRYGYSRWQVQDGAIAEGGATGAWAPGTIDRGGYTEEDRFTFTTPRAPVDREEILVTRHETAREDTYDETGAYRADIDIWEVDFQETDSTVTVSTRLAEVQEDPEEHSLWWGIAMPSGRVHEARYDIVDGKRQATSGYYDVSEGYLKWIDHPVEMTVENGSPGWVNLTLDRNDLGSPRKDERIGFLWTNTALPSSGSVYESVGPAQIIATHYLSDQLPITDQVESWFSPYWFQNDTAEATTEAQGLSFEDETGDARTPRTASLGQDVDGQYDVTYVDVTGHDEATIRASIGIQDLSSITLPPGYEAIVYTIGLETDSGTFQAFFIKDDQQQNYYCAPDTLVFPPDPTDPRQTVLTPITGIQSGASGGDGPRSGAITLYIPVEDCLGIKDVELFTVHDIGAGSYLMEDRLGVPGAANVETMDTAGAGADDKPFLLGMHTPADEEASTAAWYHAPLGLDGQDWDMLGIAVALLIASGGTLAIINRRRKLRRYLNRLNHTVSIQDLTARETGLGELREALRNDLVKGKISEGHYTIVQRQIEDAMKNVRVKSIEDTFRELPFHVVSKLRAVLDDGVITQDEREMVVDLVKRAEIPANEKQKVLSRLERWQLVDEVAKA